MVHGDALLVLAQLCSCAGFHVYLDDQAFSDALKTEPTKQPYAAGESSALAKPLPVDPQARPAGQAAVVCKHWMRGSCTKGELCPYLHDGETSTTASKVSTRRRTKPRQFSALDVERHKYKKARGQLQEQRAEAAKAAARADAERAQAKRQRNKKRSKLLQRNARGQPKTKHLIGSLLAKIEDGQNARTETDMWGRRYDSM